MQLKSLDQKNNMTNFKYKVGDILEFINSYSYDKIIVEKTVIDNGYMFYTVESVGSTKLVTKHIDANLLESWTQLDNRRLKIERLLNNEFIRKI